MAVTVQDILGVQELSLRLLAGEGHTEGSVRWVHASELEDPTPWLKGGELILTTGMGVGATPANRRAYVKRLATAGAAGLGFGLGFGHERTPRAIVNASEAAGLPLFEVPYPVPFIAITEAVFTRIVAEQYETLQRAVDAEHGLTRAVMEGKGIDGVAASLAAVTHGWVLLLDLHGIPLAATGRAASSRVGRIWEELRDSRPDSTSFSITLVDRGHHVWVQPVGAHGRVEAFLAVGKPEQPSAFDRITAGYALSMFAIELATSRAVADAQRRLRGDFFDQLAAGEVSGAEIARGLARFGFERDAEVMVMAFEGADPEALTSMLTDDRSRTDGGFLVSGTETGASLLVPAGPDPNLPEMVAGLSQRLSGDVRVGAGSSVSTGDVSRSLREAHYALQVCRLEGWAQAGFADLGTYRLLLSMTDPDALRAFADAMLAPLDAYDRDNNGELLRSLQAFLQHNARWEAAAAELYVHRHTLRYRMRKVEELSGRDLGSSFDRMEFWLALRARALISTQPPN